MSFYENVKKALFDARTKIDNPDHWSKGSLARDENFIDCDPNDELARRWCALGALRSIGIDGVVMNHAEALLFNALPGDYRAANDEPEPIADFNDRHADHAGVMAMYDRAIGEANRILMMAGESSGPAKRPDGTA